jgi:hypothetical protein
VTGYRINQDLGRTGRMELILEHQIPADESGSRLK